MLNNYLKTLYLFIFICLLISCKKNATPKIEKEILAVNDSASFIIADSALKDNICKDSAIALGLCELAKNEDNKSKAENYYKEALKISEEHNLKAMENDIYYQMALRNYTGYNYRKSYEYLDRYCKLNNELFQEKSAREMAKFEVKYDLFKKQKEIETLQLDNKIKLINIKKQKLLKFSFGIGFILIGLFSLILYHQLKKLKSAQKNLVLKNYELSRSEIIDEIPQIDPEKVCFNEKYASSNISQEQIKELLKELHLKMSAEKLYLDPEMSLNKLSKILNTNSAYLSQVINDRYGHNFNNFINEFRIKEARVMLSSRQYSNYTIEGIAQKVGFNSKSVFNTAFKKFTGITPSFYQKNVHLVQIECN